MRPLKLLSGNDRCDPMFPTYRLNYKKLGHELNRTNAIAIWKRGTQAVL